MLAGRRINDGMGKYVAENTVKNMIRAAKTVKGCRVLILGLTFKENVPDIRNTRVIDVIHELEEYAIEVIVSDPVADPAQALHEYGIKLTPIDEVGVVDALVLAVSHDAYKTISLQQYKAMCTPSSPVLVDVKSCLNAQEAEKAGFIYWSL